MNLKKLFKILVIGGAVIAGSQIGCGPDKKSDTPADGGGGGGGGVPGW